MITYYLKLYVITFTSFLIIDLIWIVGIAQSFYTTHMGFLMASSPNWVAAFLFYILFNIGLILFVVMPGLKQSSLKTAMIHAAVYGLITYGTYDLTNLALISGWPLIVTVVDMFWGMILSMSVSYISFKAGKKIG